MMKNPVLLLILAVPSFSLLRAQENNTAKPASTSASALPASLPPNTWGVGTSMPTKREWPFTGAIGQNIYVVGGANDSTVLNVNEVYNTATDTWTTAAPMPTARWDGASAVVNNVLYTIGGGVNGSEVNVVEAYDPVTNSWTTKAPMTINNDTIYAAVENNIIYVIGGCCNNGARLSTVLAYNPATNTWKTLASLKVAKSSSAVGLFGSMIVSAGGLLSSGNATTDNEAYDAASNAWTSLAPLPSARHAGCFETAGSTLYLAGGHSIGNGNPLATMDSYDASGNAWTSGLPSMPHAVVNPGSASVGGRLYCFGGSDSGGSFQGAIFDFVQIYQPGGPPSIAPGGVLSASAFGGFASIAPGSWIEIYGSNLAGDTRGWTGADFSGINAPISLDGTTVTIGGKSAFIDYISPGQVNALVSSDTPAGAQQLIVTSPSGTSTAYSITVNAAEPGILAPPSFNINGTPYAVAIFTDGAYALPTGAIAGVNSRPAKPGDVLTLYGVGFGPVVPPIPAGQLVQELNNLASSFQVSIGGMSASVLYSGLAPGFTGLYQFNVMVPAVPSGNAALTFTLGTTAGAQTLFIAIGQ